MKSFTFKSSSGTGTYTAVLADDGKLLCNCKGWTMRRGAAPRHCKHTKEIAKGQPVITRGEFVYLPKVDDLPDAREAHEDYPGQRVTGPDHATPPAPMLASAMVDAVTGAAFDARYRIGWALEEKLDGHRCTVVVTAQAVKAYSRPRAGGHAANVRHLPPHIVAELRGFPEGIYDGELVAPSGKAWDVVTVGARLVFVIFDVLEMSGLDLTDCGYTERRAALLDALGTLRGGQTAVSTVVSDPPTWARVVAIWKRGGEGVILKRTASTYRPGHRSPDWIKVKASHAATLTITGFEAGRLGPFSKLCLRDVDGHETTVKTLGNALLRDLARAPASFIGRRVVISYQEKTPSGSYRHGIFDHFAGAGE